MLEPIIGGLVLAVILGISVLHLPLWMKRMLALTPAWFQSAILHFGYAGWIGGVSGHLLGAPLAIFWYFGWQNILLPRIKEEIPARKSLKQMFSDWWDNIKLKFRSSDEVLEAATA